MDLTLLVIVFKPFIALALQNALNLLVILCDQGIFTENIWRNIDRSLTPKSPIDIL